jgi:hypothetical protein
VLNQNTIVVKKVFLNRERPIPTAQAPSVRREEIPTSNKYSPVSEQLSFMILNETSKYFPKCSKTGA